MPPYVPKKKKQLRTRLLLVALWETARLESSHLTSKRRLHSTSLQWDTAWSWKKKEDHNWILTWKELQVVRLSQNTKVRTVYFMFLMLDREWNRNTFSYLCKETLDVEVSINKQ